jgi:hypothetical protein
MQQIPEGAYEDPFADEAVILQYYKDNWPKNLKKLKSMAVQLSKEPGQKRYLVEGILNSIQRSSRPDEYLRECFKQHDDYSVLIPEFIAEGHHGILFVNRVLYPVTVVANKKWLRKSDKWDFQQELEIMESLAKEWMKENGKVRLDGKMLLFPVFGFSGLYRKLVMELKG